MPSVKFDVNIVVNGQNVVARVSAEAKDLAKNLDAAAAGRQGFRDMQLMRLFSLSYSMASIGLSLDDFCRLTPGEFEAVCKAWRDYEERMMQDSWERMRMNATITIQPHIKGKMTPERLLPFPWEKSKKKAEAPKVSAEEARKRFERLVGS